MNKTKRLTGKVGFVVCAALLGTLAGCTTYVEQPRSQGGYYPDRAPPREVYVPPPAVQVTASFGSVGVAIRTENDFYEPLSPYGRWEVVGSYGRCWIPGRVEANWRPYSDGHWRRTDAGWYWVSDEPWGWATYHYGRWDFTAQFGWYWVPQTQWAPAWVSWREGGGYVGWSPLQPSARFSTSGSLDVNVAVIAPRAYVFVEQRHFLEPVRPATVVVNNTTVINNTVNITNIKVVNNTVINEGPRTTIIEQASGQQVRAVPVRELRRQQEAEVVTRHRAASPSRENNVNTVQAPVRGESPPRETKAQPDSQRRANEADVKAQEESQRSARGLERKAQQESERRAQEAAASAQEKSKRNAQDAERTAQAESQRRANEAGVKAQEESQRSARGLERKAQQESERRAQEAAALAQEQSNRNAKDAERATQVESQRRANEAGVKAQEESRRNARGLERKAQPESERRAADSAVKSPEESQRNERGLQEQAQQVSNPPVKGRPDATEKGAAQLIKKDKKNKGKGKGKPSAPTPPASP